MWVPRQNRMGHLLAGKLQHFGDGSRGSPETGPGLSPDCLGEEEKVIQRKANYKLKTGIFLILVWKLLSAWHYSCHVCHQAPGAVPGQAGQGKHMPPPCSGPLHGILLPPSETAGHGQPVTGWPELLPCPGAPSRSLDLD